MSCMCAAMYAMQCAGYRTHTRRTRDASVSSRPDALTARERALAHGIVPSFPGASAALTGVAYMRQVPFIDEQKLLAAAASVPSESLTAEERARNCLGDILVFCHAPAGGAH